MCVSKPFNFNVTLSCLLPVAYLGYHHNEGAWLSLHPQSALNTNCYWDNKQTLITDADTHCTVSLEFCVNIRTKDGMVG